MVVKDIDREEIEFIAKTVGAIPIANIDNFTPDKLGKALSAEELTMSEGSKIVKIMTDPKYENTVTLFVRGSNNLILDEAERSLHDALCVVRSIVKKRSILAGGGSPESEVSVQLQKLGNELSGLKAYCVKAYAEALEIIPYTLAENAGLNPIEIVTELRARHIQGESSLGINVKKGILSDMFGEKVIQPTLVTLSALKLSTECVRMVLKIDDLVVCR